VTNNINDTNALLYTPEQENTIRKKWLKLFIVLLFIRVIYFVSQICCIALRIKSLTLNTNEHVSTSFYFLVTLFGAMFMLLLSYFSYYFAYKKSGTRFLVCIIFFGLLNLIINIFQSTPMLNISYIIKISMVCLTVYYLINCSKLYKLNYFLKYGPKRD